MRVPDELIKAACEAAELNRPPQMRDALEAVLPMVRERLLSEEAGHAAWEVRKEPHGAGSTFDEQYKARTQAAFDAAFPEEGPK